MKTRKLLKIILFFVAFLSITIGVTSIDHPIILKWITGSAMHHGQPMAATVYVNGEVSDRVKVYYTDEENNYLATVSEDGKASEVRFIHIDVNKKSVGVPAATSKNDYDLIAGHLFQGKTSINFLPLEDSANGRSFDSQFTFSDGQINFRMLSKASAIDSIRIILP